MKITIAAIFVLLAVAVTWGADIAVGRFSSGDLSGWRDETFKGKPKTSYQLVRENGGTVLQARSRHAASGLLRKIALDPRKYPILRWSWKIGHTLKGEDMARKSGDDFAARVYVVFPRTLFWRTRAINYVWAAKMPKNSTAPSPYTGNSIVVAVESGDEKTGNWVKEDRNVYEDYKRAFGEEPPRIGAVVVMTDTDDTGDDVTAWYGDITMASP
ncbi:MAG TPA: DUF3047 domain-containing protein [Geobacteraceae bacterium]